MSSDGQPLFSIVVVSLNPGRDLALTLDSIFDQTFDDYEIVIKDGGSTDGSVDQVSLDRRIRLIRESDSGIFDAMNQAVVACRGRFINFLNCGDVFYDSGVLSMVAETIRACAGIRIFYGDVHKPGSRSGYMIYPNRFSRYFLYAYSVCQQALFVERDLLRRESFSTLSAIGGDDIWWKRVVAGQGESVCKVPAVVVTYKGGGVSEDAGRQLASQPHREAAKREAFSALECLFYRFRFQVRSVLKAVFYDPFLWKCFRLYRKWKLRR